MKIFGTKDMAYAVNSIAVSKDAIAVSNSTVTEVLVYPKESDDFSAFAFNAGSSRQNRIITYDSQSNCFAAIVNAGKNVAIFNQSEVTQTIRREHFLFEYVSKNTDLNDADTLVVLRKPQMHIYKQLSLQEQGEVGHKADAETDFTYASRAFEALACVGGVDGATVYVAGNLEDAPYAFGVMLDTVEDGAETAWLQLRDEPANFAQIIINRAGYLFVMAEFSQSFGFWLINAEGESTEVQSPYAYAFDSYAICVFRDEFYILYSAEDKRASLLRVNDNHQAELAATIKGKATKGIAATDDYIVVAIDTKIVFITED